MDVSFRPLSSEGVCECLHCEHVLVFLGVRGNFCILHVPYLLLGDVYHVKNDSYLLEIFYDEVF